MNSPKKGQSAHDGSPEVPERGFPGDKPNLVFRFADYQDWAEELDTAVWTFGMEFRTFPGIMVASSATYDRIDEMAKEHGFTCFRNSITGLAPDEVPREGLSFFDAPDYRIEFAVHDVVPEGIFVLVLDPEAEWEDDPEE